MEPIASVVSQELERIRQEERYRSLVREELNRERAGKVRSTLLGFFNSQLGIWLLGALFITGGTYLYNGWRENAKITRERVEARKLAEQRVIKLQVEFSHRLSQALSKLKVASLKSSPLDIEQARGDALAPLSAASPLNIRPLHFEFAQYSGMEVLIELSNMADPTKRTALKSMVSKLSMILNDPTSVKLRANGDFRDVAAALLRHTQGWAGEQGFVYTDCTPDDPFCEK